MLIKSEVTAAQLIAAYEAGQRRFIEVEVVGPGPSVVDARLSGSEFINCWFHSTTFANVDFGQARFIECNLKCAIFRGCNLNGSTWEGCAVCSISISTCETVGLEASDLHAYGARIHGTLDFLDYAHANAQKDRMP